MWHQQNAPLCSPQETRHLTASAAATLAEASTILPYHTQRPTRMQCRSPSRRPHRGEVEERALRQRCQTCFAPFVIFTSSEQSRRGSSKPLIILSPQRAFFSMRLRRSTPSRRQSARERRSRTSVLYGPTPASSPSTTPLRATAPSSFATVSSSLRRTTNLPLISSWPLTLSF